MSRALSALGEQTGPALLVRTLETLGQAIVDMRGTDAADPRLVLEIALVRLARRDAGPPMQALAERVDRLEQQLGGGAVAAAPAPQVAAPVRLRRRRPKKPSRQLARVRRRRSAPAVASGPHSPSLPNPSAPSRNPSRNPRRPRRPPTRRPSTSTT